MALEDILREVEERSSAERSSVQEEHDRNKSRILQETEEAVKKLEEEFSRKIADDSSAFERREKDLMELESKRIIDGKKNDLISEEASIATDLIKSGDTGIESHDLIDLMIKSGKKKLGDDISVRCSHENADYVRKKVRNVIADLSSSEQGIICISSDRKRILDLTVDFILDDIHEDMLDGISRKARVM